MLQRLEGCFYEKCWQKKEATKRVKHLQQQMDEDACIYRKFFFSLSLSYPFFHVICTILPSSSITLCPSTSCFTIIRLWGSSKERVEEGQHQLFSVCPILCPSLKLVSWDALNALLLHHPHHPSRRDSKFVQQKHTEYNSIQKAELRLHERLSQI